MPKEANLAGLDRSEIDDRPRHVRAAEQNLAQHYKLILDEGTRRTYYRRGGTTLAGPSYGRALEIAELFGADYPGQIVRIPARPGQRKKPHDETTTLDQTPTQEPAPPAEDPTMTETPIILDRPDYTAAQLAEITRIDSRRFAPLYKKADSYQIGYGSHQVRVYEANERLVAALAGYGVTAVLPGHSGDGQASTEPEPAAEVVQISAEPVQIADEVVPVPAEAVHNPAESVHTGAEDPAEAPQAETEAVRAELEQQAYRNRRMYPILEAEPAPRFWFERTPEERILDFLSPVRGFTLVEDAQPDPEIEHVRRVVERVHQAPIQKVRQIVVENPAEHLSAAAGELAAALLEGDQVTIGRARRALDAAVSRCNRAASELANASARILDQVHRAQRLVEACEEIRQPKPWWRGLFS